MKRYRRWMRGDHTQPPTSHSHGNSISPQFIQPGEKVTYCAVTTYKTLSPDMTTALCFSWNGLKSFLTSDSAANRRVLLWKKLETFWWKSAITYVNSSNSLLHKNIFYLQSEVAAPESLESTQPKVSHSPTYKYILKAYSGTLKSDRLGGPF